jgi:hypothetical protein
MPVPIEQVAVLGAFLVLVFASLAGFIVAVGAPELRWMYCVPGIMALAAVGTFACILFLPLSRMPPTDPMEHAIVAPGLGLGVLTLGGLLLLVAASLRMLPGSGSNRLEKP